MGRFHSIEAKLEGKELTKAIGDLAEGGDDKFMKVGMVSKAKFDALVDASFPGDASAGAREVWDRMVAQAQVTNKALIEHQKALLNQAKVEAFFVQAKLVKNFASGDTSTTATVKSQVFWQLYDESYAQQKASVVKYYLDVIRAIVAIKLELTLIPRSLIALGCWDNMTGSLFDDVVLPQLRAENDYLMWKDTRLAPKTTTYKGYITKDDNPYIFGYEAGALTDTGAPPVLDKKSDLRPFSLMIDSTNCHRILGIDLKMECDVRMVQCWVALEGARLKKEKDADLVISVNTSFSGGFYVTPSEVTKTVDEMTHETHEEDVEYMFEIDEVTTGCRYEYDKSDPTKKCTCR